MAEADLQVTDNEATERFDVGIDDQLAVLDHRGQRADMTSTLTEAPSAELAARDLVGLSACSTK
jgi:hypothetical protein